MKKRSAEDVNGEGRGNYRVREFADLGGVTVKALLHYDRLGLLAPARTSAGHRRYSARDLERLRHILALKRVGLPLMQMRGLLDAEPTTLRARLAVSRERLDQERERLRRAGRAIALVEESLRHTPSDEGGLSRLADAIDMQRDAAQMRRYFSEDVWERARRFYEDWPTEHWIGLCRDIAAAFPDGPESARAEDLLRRWDAFVQSLWRALASDPGVSPKLHEGFARAWRDRANWPDTLKRRFGDYRIDEVSDFLKRVSIAVWNRRGAA